MSEDQFRDKEVLPALRSFGYAQRIENSLGSDLADLIYCVRLSNSGPGYAGWMELKHAHKWPGRLGSPLRFNHFTTGQALFLDDWYTPGSKTCLLAKVSTDYFLMSGKLAKRLQKGMTQKEIIDEAVVVGTNNVFPVGRIIRWLTER